MKTGRIILVTALIVGLLAEARATDFETLKVQKEGGVVFAKIKAPPMNILGPELVRDLVSLIQQSEADQAVQVLVFKSADRDYFISHVDVTRIGEFREAAAELTRDASLGATGSADEPVRDDWSRLNEQGRIK